LYCHLVDVIWIEFDALLAQQIEQIVFHQFAQNRVVVVLRLTSVATNQIWMVHETTIVSFGVTIYQIREFGRTS
jgi:hypothetical protein